MMDSLTVKPCTLTKYCIKRNPVIASYNPLIYDYIEIHLLIVLAEI